MNAQISQATQQVERDVARDIVWFTPPDEKRFDPASLTVAFALLLVHSFVSGFVEEAKKDSHAAGGDAFRRLAESARLLFGGHPAPAAPPASGDALAEQAAAAAKSLPQDELRLTLTRTETGMRLYLEENMPEDRAAALAAAIRQAATAHVLQPPAP